MESLLGCNLTPFCDMQGKKFNYWDIQSSSFDKKAILRSKNSWHTSGCCLSIELCEITFETVGILS